MENSNLINLLPVSDDIIMNQIYIIREQKVMIDKDLAILYGVETRVLKQAIKRNLDRFPKDFMFELSTEEANSMLSSILNSPIAIQVNIHIIRIFVKMRHLLTDQLSVRLEIADIKDKLLHQDKKQDSQNKNIEIIFQYLDELQNRLVAIDKPKKKIGFKHDWE